MHKIDLPDWDRVLSAAARLQAIVPGSVLVGGTAAALCAKHRMSIDADHVITNLREDLDEILAQLESVAGWKTARVHKHVMFQGSLDGIDTGIRQLIRSEPLESVDVSVAGARLRIPTQSEILRIKGALILKRNATRDYRDFVALAASIGDEHVANALCPFDRLYPQDNGASPCQQLLIQLATPQPYDVGTSNLMEYKGLGDPWLDWNAVVTKARSLSILILDHVLANPNPDECHEDDTPGLSFG